MSVELFFAGVVYTLLILSLSNLKLKFIYKMKRMVEQSFIFTHLINNWK